MGLVAQRQVGYSQTIQGYSRTVSDTGIEPVSLALAGRFFTTEPPGKPKHHRTMTQLENWKLVCHCIIPRALLVKNLPAMLEISVQFLGQEDLLEKG